MPPERDGSAEIALDGMFVDFERVPHPALAGLGLRALRALGSGSKHQKRTLGFASGL
jgi:hypothetical protein